MRTAVIFEPMLSPEEARATLGVSRTTLLRWEAGGILTPARTPGGQRRYARSQVTAIRTRGYSPAAAPLVPDGRCRRCAYPEGSPGHRASCAPAAAIAARKSMARKAEATA